jgi:hypothetical protein
MRKAVVIALISTLVVLTLPNSYAADSTNPYGTPSVDPAGPNEVIFTISKSEKKITFTAAKLAKLNSSTISIYEPFLKKRQKFTVIPIKTFFGLVGVTSKDKVFTTALNDYVYSNTASKFLAAGTFIAIKREGKDIPYDQGGPLRIVFADKSTWAKNLDAWNWSLESISVK